MYDDKWRRRNRKGELLTCEVEGEWGIGKVSVPADKTVWNNMNEQHTAVLGSGYWSSDSDVIMAVPACPADVIVHEGHSSRGFG